MSEQHPDIDSFLIRFVRTANAESGLQLRGSIRHLQTNEERSFVRWQDVEHFIRRFIPLEGDRPDATLSDTRQPDPH